MKQWLGIPYAAPPFGKLRWHPPISPTPWEKNLDTFDFGGICAQEEQRAFPGFGHESITEDCLYLDVYAPDSDDTEDTSPVMVWLHDGGLLQGATND